MIEGAIFLGACIIAATQAIKYLVKDVNGVVTIAVAVLLGILIALIDKEIGVTDLTVAQGILLGLASVGVHSVAREI